MFLKRPKIKSYRIRESAERTAAPTRLRVAAATLDTFIISFCFTKRFSAKKLSDLFKLALEAKVAIIFCKIYVFKNFSSRRAESSFFRTHFRLESDL